MRLLLTVAGVLISSAAVVLGLVTAATLVAVAIFAVAIDHTKEN